MNSSLFQLINQVRIKITDLHTFFIGKWFITSGPQKQSDRVKQLSELYDLARCNNENQLRVIFELLYTKQKFCNCQYLSFTPFYIISLKFLEVSKSQHSKNILTSTYRKKIIRVHFSFTAFTLFYKKLGQVSGLKIAYIFKIFGVQS